MDGFVGNVLGLIGSISGQKINPSEPYKSSRTKKPSPPAIVREDAINIYRKIAFNNSSHDNNDDDDDDDDNDNDDDDNDDDIAFSMIGRS